MKKILKLWSARQMSQADVSHREAVQSLIWFAASNEPAAVYERLGATPDGLNEDQVKLSKDTYGANTVTHGKKESLFTRIIHAFVNPFTAILFALAAVSLLTDISFAAPGEKDATTVVIITAMVMISGVLRFVQETRSGNAAARLSAMIRTTTCVTRVPDGRAEIPMDDVVVGDLVILSAGDMVPADMRIVAAKDLFVAQSALTGESEPVEKLPRARAESGALTDVENLAWMGSTVLSGSAVGVVVAVGNDTLLGEMARSLSIKPPKTTFEKGVNAVSWVLIRFMLVMVPVVLFLNGFTKGNWMNAILFAISVAVGLTPEMLPMIVTTCLAKGAVSMSKKRVILKNLNAIQNLGSMDILCTDKTGTLTQDRVVLERYLDIHGQEDPRVLRHGFLNSYFQTGLKNLIDLAIIARNQTLLRDNPSEAAVASAYTKVDEIPFDFDRRRMSVVVADKSGKTQLITKGAVEEMLAVCAFAEYDGKIEPLTEAIRTMIRGKVDALNDEGMRVIAVAQKNNPAPVGAFSTADESQMVLIGYLAFLDPPKDTTAAAIEAMRAHGVTVKVLTGDNDRVTRCICRKVGLNVQSLLLGADIEGMDDKALAEAAEHTTVFAKLSPAEKARVVRVLRENGHSVGYMGDGINDAAAMRAADVGISVDTAVDIAKESAGVILLEKDLMVLKAGIQEGRITYANMIKYIKMTASSNFGNMLSVLVASAFLPFLPMESIHLILLNLIYDISCTAIPWDHVDKEYLLKPRKWDASSVGKFMIWIGPTSSVFDIATYALLFFVVCPAACGGLAYRQITDPAIRALFVSIFQAGWFLESMWSQTLVIHMIRTPKIPFIQSRAAAPVTLLTLAGLIVATLIPFTPAGNSIGLAPLPLIYFAWLAVIVVCYMLLATGVKRLYIQRYGELL